MDNDSHLEEIQRAIRSLAEHREAQVPPTDWVAPTGASRTRRPLLGRRAVVFAAATVVAALVLGFGWVNLQDRGDQQESFVATTADDTADNASETPVEADPELAESAIPVATEPEAATLLFPNLDDWVVVDRTDGPITVDLGDLPRGHLHFAPVDGNSLAQFDRTVQVDYARGSYDTLAQIVGDAAPIDGRIEIGVTDATAWVFQPGRSDYQYGIVWRDGVFLEMQTQFSVSDGVDLIEVMWSLTPFTTEQWTDAISAAEDNKARAVNATAGDVVLEPRVPAEEFPRYVLAAPWEIAWVTDMTIWTDEQHRQRVALDESFRSQASWLEVLANTTQTFGFDPAGSGEAEPFVPEVFVAAARVADPDQWARSDGLSDGEPITALGFDGHVERFGGSGTAAIQLSRGDIRINIFTETLGNDGLREFLDAAALRTDDPLDGVVIEDTRFQLIDNLPDDDARTRWTAAWQHPDRGDAVLSVSRLDVAGLRNWASEAGRAEFLPENIWDLIAAGGVIEVGSGATYDVEQSLLTEVGGVDRNELVPIPLDEWITLVEPFNADPLNPR